MGMGLKNRKCSALCQCFWWVNRIGNASPCEWTPFQLDPSRPHRMNTSAPLCNINRVDIGWREWRWWVFSKSEKNLLRWSPTVQRSEGQGNLRLTWAEHLRAQAEDLLLPSEFRVLIEQPSPGSRLLSGEQAGMHTSLWALSLIPYLPMAVKPECS